MGSVLSVQPSLEQVNVLVEVKEPTTVIPRNSLIEANQSGLIAESLIDITPQLPIPDYKVRQQLQDRLSRQHHTADTAVRTQPMPHRATSSIGLDMCSIANIPGMNK